MTKEGRHAALDVIGVFLEPADVLNAVLYLTEGELGDAALSGISMVPMLGDLFGKGGKGTKYLMKAADVTKLNRNKKVVKVLDSIDIFVKARKADMGELQKWIRKSLDNLANGGDEVVELVTPDGLRIRINGDLRANINLMDETGDMVQETVRLGNKADDGGTVLKAGSGTLEGVGKNFTNTEAVSISGKRAIDYGQSYEMAVRDLYGDVPFGQRQYEVLVDGQWVEGVADNVVQIGGKNTAIEAKYVDDWVASLRNPLSPNGTEPLALAEQQKMLNQAQKYSSAFDQVIYHTNSVELASYYSDIFKNAGITNFKFVITPVIK